MAQSAISGVWRPRRRPSIGLLPATIVALVASVTLTGVAFAAFTRSWTEGVARRIDKVAALALAPPGMDARSKVLAADGTLIAVLHGDENREPITLADMPDFLRRAVVAIEDQRFFTHDGVDMTALGRALVVNTLDAGISQGGGTITMQLARNAYLRDRSRTIARKWDEIVLARRLEARLSKEEILEQYLNSVYFGRGAHGIQAGAEAYFNKPAAKLALGEAAFLAGVIRSPESYEPARALDAALARRDSVLEAMVAQGLLDEPSRVAAVQQELKFRRTAPTNGIDMVADAGGTFVEFVKQELLRDPRLGDTSAERAKRLFNGGLRITTTLDLAEQRAAERAIREVLDRRGDPSAGLAAVEPATGAIRAMAGGTDAQGFNLAAQGRRQPGSAFKPFTLVAALEDGMSVQARYDGSAPRTFRLSDGQTWVVHNYVGSREGMMSLRTATEQSVNAVYAQVVMDVGADSVVDVAQRMGITSPLDPFPSIALGGLRIGVSPLEMASAYGTLAASGTAHPPYAIITVEDRSGQLFAHSPAGREVIDPEIADRATAVLRGVVENGTGRRAQGLGRPSAGKTGTTDDYRDSWYVGFTPELSAAVWIGYPQARIPLLNIHGLPRVFGGSLPAEIWTRFMSGALKGRPVIEFPDVSFGDDSTGTSPASDLPSWFERLREESRESDGGHGKGRRRRD